MNVKPHHVDADGDIIDIKKLHAINFIPVLDYPVCAVALRDIA